MASTYRTVATPVAVVGDGLPRKTSFDASERRRLVLLYAFVALLHVAGWGLYLYFARSHPPLVGLGLVAYLFGLRHAFDADHIAAIDDTVRYMLQRGQRPLAVGFFFSLGHSTIVVVMALAIGLTAGSVQAALPGLQQWGPLIGASVSAMFLWSIGLLNLFVLFDMLNVRRQAKRGGHSHAHVEHLLAGRGVFTRIFGGRLQSLVRHSYQMYPLGLLFGLGFDTASEIGLLAMTAGAATGALPLAAIASLPLLFAAGMTALDTTDGVLMVKAYAWAFVNPLRKIFYNLAITSVSVAVALVIGTIEILQVIVNVLHLDGAAARAIAAIDFGITGYLIVAVLMVAWLLSLAMWRLGRLDQRMAQGTVLHDHAHDHGIGQQHAHRHFHDAE